MFITFGLDGTDTPENIREYMQYGAEEFFAGYVPEEWLNRYGWEIGPNHRPLNGSFNFTSPKQLGDAVKAIHDLGGRATFTLNTHDNGSERLPYLHKLVDFFEPLNPDGYIVADPAMMFTLKNWGITRPLHISTGVGCFSSEAIRFFCKQFDVKRVVIPRKLTIREIRLITENLQDIHPELEIMIIGERCNFNNEDCHSVHSSVRRSLCQEMELAESVVARRYPDNWKDYIQAMIDNRDDFKSMNEILTAFRNELNAGSEAVHAAIEAAIEAGTPPVNPPPSCSGCGGCGGSCSSYENIMFSREPVDAMVPKSYIQNCGLCAIKAFREMGIQCLKVPFRGYRDYKLQALKMVHAVMTAENPTVDFCKSLVNSPDYCDDDSNCYYDVPEAHLNLRH